MQKARLRPGFLLGSSWLRRAAPCGYRGEPAGGARQDTLQVHPCKLGRGIHAADGPARPTRRLSTPPCARSLESRTTLGSGRSRRLDGRARAAKHGLALPAAKRRRGPVEPTCWSAGFPRRPLIQRGAQGTGAQHRHADGGAFPPRSRKAPAGHGPALPARVRTEIRSIADRADSISAASGSSMQ